MTRLAAIAGLLCGLLLGCEQQPPAAPNPKPAAPKAEPEPKKPC